MNIEQARQTFVLEARKHLRHMEELLLALETDPDDREAMEALFRSVHTIKGSAGMFDFEQLVSFTHVVENVLARLRDGAVPVTKELIALLLSCADHLTELVERVGTEDAEAHTELDVRGSALLEQLQMHAGAAPVAAPEPPSNPSAEPAETAAAAAPAAGNGKVKNDNWHISLRFGRDVLRNGLDPLPFLRYLETHGRVVSITPLLDTMPAAAEMDPESCYLGLEIDFASDADKETIANVFEFLRADCRIRILPPHSQISDYIAMIDSLPEDRIRLGELLVRSGALTPDELEEGLRIQACPAGADPQTCVYRAQGSCDGKRCLSDPTLQCRFEASEAPPQRPKLGEVLVGEGMVQREIVDGALARQKRTREGMSRDQRFLHVHADKLDHLINLVGELVIASAGASLLAQNTGDNTLFEAMSSVSRLVDEIRGGALQLRMVPIGEVFGRFKRLVRDLSQELGKEIELVVTGADTELDKTVIEKISDPLIHLVRNAIDHGIEPADVRAARRKPAKGTVHLNAFHDSGSIVIEVRDDGAGFDRDRILETAIARGIIAAGQELSDREVFNLVFEPGFSTTEQVTNLSGRGVGMDVVRRSIEALRGTIDIDSVEASGTTVRIRLPLTLAIIDGFLMGVAGASYVVPLETVVECVELDAPGGLRRNYIDLRGEVLPCLRLRDHFRLEGKTNRRESVVVVQYGDKKAGLIVDRLMGEFQTVIRPLGRIFRHLRGVSGTTILGNGEVALIMDVPALIQHVISMEPHPVAVA